MSWVTQGLWLDRLMARDPVEPTGANGVAFGLLIVLDRRRRAGPISRLCGFHASVTIAILSVN
jgi:hypothetical protein